jgi:hypothetical protein
MELAVPEALLLLLAVFDDVEPLVLALVFAVP